MVRMPVVPDNYFDSDQVATGGASDAPDEPIDSQQNAEQSPKGILDGLPEPRPLNSLSLLLEPQDIADVPGLAAHDYKDAGVPSLADYADRRVQQDFAGLGDLSGSAATPALPSTAAPVHASRQPTGYASTFDHVSLTQPNWNSPGLNLSQNESVPKATDTGGKLESAGTGASILGHGIDLWNAQNALVGIPLGQEGARLLRGYTKPVAEALGPVAEGIKGYSEWKNGAPIVPTATGTAASAITGWAGARIGALGGAEAGAWFGQPEVGMVIGGAFGGLAPEFAYRHMSQQQIGNAMENAYGRIADAYGRTISVDPRSVLP